MSRASSIHRRRKVLAVIAGGTALGVAGMLTLAAWNDNEWVFGGTGPGGGESGVGTSEFNVQQRVWAPGGTVPLAADPFVDAEENPGEALIFNVDPSALTPGTTIYAAVAMKTAATSIAGSLALTQPVAAAGMTSTDGVDGSIAEGALWDALNYSVRVTTDSTVAATCDATGFPTYGSLVVEDATLNTPLNTPLDTPPGTIPVQELAAAGGDVQYYCFAITLPNSPDTQLLQGRTVFPAWRFAATSE